MLRPLLPMANDWWQHEFNNVEHLACVHAVYGSNHLQKETANNADKAKKQTGVKGQSDNSFHIPTYHVIKCAPTAIYIFKKQVGIYIFQLPFSTLSNIAPPPKF